MNLKVDIPEYYEAIFSSKEIKDNNVKIHHKNLVQFIINYDDESFKKYLIYLMYYHKGTNILDKLYSIDEPQLLYYSIYMNNLKIIKILKMYKHPISKFHNNIPYSPLHYLIDNLLDVEYSLNILDNFFEYSSGLDIISVINQPIFDFDNSIDYAFYQDKLIISYYLKKKFCDCLLFY